MKATENFRYIWGIFNNFDCKLYRINGVEDHLHILCSLHPTMNLSALIKAIKTGSGKWIRATRTFPKFTYWQKGYSAFTVSPKEKVAVNHYIINQENHHKLVTFEEELRALLVEAGISFDEKYLL